MTPPRATLARFRAEHTARQAAERSGSARTLRDLLAVPTIERSPSWLGMWCHVSPLVLCCAAPSLPYQQVPRHDQKGNPKGPYTLDQINRVAHWRVVSDITSWDRWLQFAEWCLDSLFLEYQRNARELGWRVTNHACWERVFWIASVAEPHHLKSRSQVA